MASVASAADPSPVLRLVDVDCNLWHADLRRPLLPSANDSEDGGGSTDDCNSDSDPFRILADDAVREQRIVALLAPSSTLAEAAAGLAALRQRQKRADPDPPPLPAIRTTVGVHPYHVTDESLRGQSIEAHMATLRDLIAAHPTLCAAVGECGLDATEGFPALAEQVPWFRAQIAVAQDLGLPLFVHERGAFETCMELLDGVTVPVIVHCFTGTPEEGAAYVARGYSLSLSGHLFRPDAGATRDCLRRGLIPLDRLMVETDAPYMGFAGCRAHFLAKQADAVAALNAKRRKRLQSSTYPNLPSALPLVMDKILEELNAGRQERQEARLTREELANWTARNAAAFFGLPVD